MINGQYSILRYSSNSGTEIEINATFFEELKGVSGSAVFVDISGSFDESTVCIARVTASIITKAEISNIFGKNVNMSADVIVSDIFLSNLYGKIDASQNFYIETLFPEYLLSHSYLSSNIPAHFTSLDDVSGKCYASKNITDISFFGTEIILATVSGGTVEDLILSINVSIPPGGELRIDSDNYTVLLDGENVLYSQSGYWPILSRELSTMTIDSGTGGEISGEIVFSERWL